MHKHRIIPGHMGGKYTPENIFICSVEWHAVEHLLLFLQWKCWQDEVAYKALTGLINCEETVRLVQSASGRKPCKPETRRKIGVANKGKVRTKETKHKLSIAHMGHGISDIHKAKLLKSHLGKKESDATRLKKSIAMQGNTNGRFRRNVKHSEETKLKMSLARKAYLLSKVT